MKLCGKNTELKLDYACKNCGKFREFEIDMIEYAKNYMAKQAQIDEDIARVINGNLN